ncbi:hypothetical protein BGZ65_001479 [Modicella reniformis]|uniref:Thioredoxin domain-containing protein n=1 Tax=Modicella reniformis TaxID=1440133 RepID=A0A9P6IM29_9FUNG|nr:hypothetical protein BGZ65_001479 [Modicella reniformis]
MNSLRLLSRNVHQVPRSGSQGKARRPTRPRLFQGSSPLLTGKVHDATDETFETLLSAKEPVLVDFHADWCKPCHILDPIIRGVVEKSRAVTLLRVNVEDCPKASSKYQIASIPCVMAFKNGQMVDSFVGALPKSTIEAFVEKHAARA